MTTLLEINNEIKDVERFLEEYLNDNNITRDDIYVNIIEQEKKILKSQKFTVEIVKKSNIINFVKVFIQSISQAFQMVINSEINFKDDALNIILTSENNAILIGKDGKNLNAIQLLLKQSLKSQTNLNFKIYLDIGNYKAKKINNLEYQVKKIAKEVLKTKIEAKLDSMNSYERRIVHNVVNEFEELETESFGEEPERYVVIRTKE